MYEMDKVRINKIVEAIEEGARKHWPAMFNTPQYKGMKFILSKPEDKITWADKEELGYALRLLSQFVKVDYYGLIAETR